ncbi:MAG: Ig-like domain-containing protein [Chloroflexi bacterium]|nr:Ig-like domain-containing protein [Chloroflexota bacterium]
MNCRTVKGIRSAALLCALLALLAPAWAGVAFAETHANATKISLSIGKTPKVGENVKLGAKLVDAAGAPLAGVKVAFVVPNTFFLGSTADVLIAEVQTDKEGVAETEYSVRNPGWLDVRAEFRGNDRYTSARATDRFLVDEPAQQLYVQHAGVQIPGLNTAPGGQQSNAEMNAHGSGSPATGLGALWPTLSVWPIVLVLLTIWSLYGVAVSQIFRIASAGGSGTLSSQSVHAGASGVRRKGEGQ